MADARGMCPAPIDAEQLERIARIARGLPGCVVSVERRASTPGGGRGKAAAGDRPAVGDRLEPDLLVRLDGIAAADFLERYERGELM